MPSQLITLAFDDPKADQARSFARHLGDLLELEGEDLDRCLDVMPAFGRASTAWQENEIIDKLKAKSSAERHQLARAISVLRFFVNGLLSDEIPDDDFEAWSDDLQGYGWLDAEGIPKFDRIIRRLRDSLPALRAQTEERRTAAGVLPLLKVASYTVESRPIRRQRYRWGDSADKYQPQIVGTVPVVSIHIGLDVKLATDIYFQADELGLHNMLETLEAAIKDIAALRAYLPPHSNEGRALDG